MEFLSLRLKASRKTSTKIVTGWISETGNEILQTLQKTLHIYNNIQH